MGGRCRQRLDPSGHQIGSGVNRQNARDGPCCLSIDAENIGVGVRGAKKNQMSEPVALQIIGKFTFAPQ